MEETNSAPLALRKLLMEAFGRLDLREARELSALVGEEAAKRGFTYMRAGGAEEVMNIMLIPSFFTEPQVAYLHGLSRAVKRGVSAVWREYFNDPDLQGVLPLNETERSWMRGLRPDSLEGGDPLWYRLDVHAHMNRIDWKDSISVFEINSCAVGGIHYSPVAESLFEEIILPYLKPRLPQLPPLVKNPDLRDLLYGLLRRHAVDIGRKTLTVAFSEDTTLKEGITEGPYIVEHLRSKGVKAFVADPRELYVRDGELYYRDTPVDMVYRNFEIGDIIEMDAEGDNTAGVRFAFRDNRMVSSLAGDLDHKSMWEVLTSGRFDKYFSKEDAALFKKHLLWTRTVRESRTDGPLSSSVDLVRFVAANRDTLVLKPNRLFGGYGVTIGRNATESQWDSAIERAVNEEGEWVVQSYNAPERSVFPLFEKGGLVFEEHNIVYGISSTRDGSGVLGRVSRESVVNVAQQGGLMPVVRVE